MQGSDSNFYGTTEFGGMNGQGFTNGNNVGYGTVFRISPDGSYTNLYSFAGYPNDGANPSSGLVQGSDGNFYGTTQYGGTNPDCGYGCGTVFRISSSGNETILYSFYSYPSDGVIPSGGLVQGSDSNFYGTTAGGGTSTNGTVFRISPSGTYLNLYSFGSHPNDGSGPIGDLVQVSDGNFYGTTISGGANTGCSSEYLTGCGTVFKLDVGLGPCGGASISPTNAVFGTAGGSDSVSVTASNSCAWTATSNAGFITITSGSSGSGNGTVGYTVDANTSTTPLTGTVYIADQVFTVTQAGLPWQCLAHLDQCQLRRGGRLQQCCGHRKRDQLRMDGDQQLWLHYHHFRSQWLRQWGSRLHGCRQR